MYDIAHKIGCIHENTVPYYFFGVDGPHGLYCKDCSQQVDPIKQAIETMRVRETDESREERLRRVRQIVPFLHVDNMLIVHK